jgi:hypothetical protein
VLEDRADLFCQTGSHALVRIQRQDPVVRGKLRCPVLLGAVTRPVADLDARGPATRDVRCTVRAAGVDDDDLVGPGHRLERRPDVSRLVECDDRDGQLHDAQCTSKRAARQERTAL